MAFVNIPTPPRFGGLDENENPQDLAPEDLSIALNIYRRGGALSTRPGSLRESTGDWDATIEDGGGVGDPCQGLYDISTTNDSVRRLIGIFGGEAYRAHVSGVMPTLTAGAPLVALSTNDDDYWTFATGRGAGTVKVYATGGSLTTPNVLMSYDPSTAGNDWIDVTSGWGGTWPGARYIMQWSNYGFICGMDGTGPDTHPMVVRYSALGNMDEWPAGNVIGGTYAIGGLPSDGSEYTTGFGAYQDNEGKFLMVLTNRAVYSVVQTSNQFAPFRITDRAEAGCVSQRAFVSLGNDSGDAIYLSERGIHSLRQSQVYGSREDRYLSWKIRDTFATINRARLKYAVGAYDEENGIVLFAVPTGSNTENNLILALDVRDATSGTKIETGGINAESARWYKWITTGTNHNCAELISARDRITGKHYVYGANYKGDVFRFDDAGYSDLDGAYPIDMAGRWEDDGAPGVKKAHGSAHLHIGPNADYKPRFHMEYDYGESSSRTEDIDLSGSGAKWGTATWGTDRWAAEGGALTLRRKRIYVRGHAEMSRWRIQHGGGNQPVFLSRVIRSVDGIGKDMGDANAA